MKHKVLSVKQPWSFLICSGIKDIENRTWKLPEKYKGERVLIHASAPAKIDFGRLFDYDQLYKVVERFGSLGEFRKLLHFGAIIGSVRFVDCVINHPSIWAEKDVSQGMDKTVYNWVATDAVLLEKPILNVKGKLRFWNYPMSEEEYNNLIKIGV